MRLKKELITKLNKSQVAEVPSNESRIVRYTFHAEGHLSASIKQETDLESVPESELTN